MENLDVITSAKLWPCLSPPKPGIWPRWSFHETCRRRRAERRHRPGAPGLKVGWVSRVGNDSFGRFVLQSLAKEGIDSHAVAIDNRFATGFQMKSKVENGTDPIVEYFRKGSAASHLSPDDFAPTTSPAPASALSGVAAALSESSYALLEHAAKVMKAEGKTLSSTPICPGAVEKRSRDGGETQPSRLPGLTGFCQA
ncbi:2-ketogluconate kinase [Klebsiella pneumoniae]|uniref:2-ketogluconate kinase n=1 Tax=Klebsiella pneumoniae TaxID=573 RepID=A0A378FQE6_KLEPN|nr:2-ketogluconate kinase [Klebsiella pneumoniae]